MTDANLQRAYLDAMGVRLWARRGGVLAAPSAESLLATPAEESVAAPLAVPVFDKTPEPDAIAKNHLPASSGDVSALDWDGLQQRVAACQQCNLCQTRKNTVFGVGNRQAELMFIGEAPGADEDLQGEPFVGRAGKLLDGMILALGMKREDVFIANVLKCRPPGNRDPEPDEVQQCLPYLERQVALLKPKMIVALGRIAAQNLLATATPLGQLRGKVHAFSSLQVPLVVTYHPAYLLRTPAHKGRAWEDLLFARSVLTR